MADIPPTTTMASGCAVWPPILVDTAAGKRPSMAVSAVIITGRTRLPAPCMIASWSGRPWARRALKYEISSKPSMMAIPKRETKPTAAAILKLVPVKYNAQMPPTATSKTLLKITSVSRIERKAEYRRMKIRVSDKGMIHMSRPLASSICSNSPLQTAR